MIHLSPFHIENILKGNLEVLYRENDVCILIPHSPNVLGHYDIRDEIIKEHCFILITPDEDKVVYIGFIQEISLPEEANRALIGWRDASIRIMKEPSREIQKLAIEKNPHAIRHIRNPLEEIQRLAVQKYELVIRHISNPSEEVQRLAVREKPYAIRYIRNPSHEVQRIAIEQRGSYIRYIKNPSYEIQRLAVL